MATLNPITLPVQCLRTPPPSLEELALVIEKGLKENFQSASVEVVNCPDLTQPPFRLAAKGLGGDPKLLEIGGPPYLLPLVQTNKLYDLKEMPGLLKVLPDAFIIGAGAGPFPHAGKNCEGVYNLTVNSGTVVQQGTRISKVDENNESVPIQELLPASESRIALLGNLFISEGKPGKVLKIHAKKRVGSKDFAASIRESLETDFKERVVGLGGTFLISGDGGKVKQHVMPAFSKTPLNTDDEVNNWLKFYDMSTPLVAVGTLTNSEAGLDLRVQHFHSFSEHGEAGHYHIDKTPETIEYLGYFNAGEEIWRVDRPVVTHHVGRD